MNQLEQFREQCAKTIELYDDATMSQGNYMLNADECADIIRALPLPEVKQEHPTTPNTYGGFSASFYVINNRKPTGQEIFNAGRRSGLNDVEALRKENEQLRELLCLRSSSSTHLPYMDDGELQDNSAFPHIDFKRDSVAEIISKLQQRTLKELRELKGGAA